MKKGQLLFKYNDPTAKQGVTEAEMQKKIAQKEVTLFQNKLMRRNKNYKKIKMQAFPLKLKASEAEVGQLESQLEMKKFEVEKADEMIKATRESKHSFCNKSC